MDHCFGMVEDGFRGEDEEGLAEGVLRANKKNCNSFFYNKPTSKPLFFLENN